MCEVLIICGARYFDSESLEFYDNRQLWIDDGKIVDIGVHLNQAGREVVNLRGCLVLPGWIDAHLHLTLSGDKDPVGKWQEEGIILTVIRIVSRYLQKHLQAGVTVIRDLGGDGDIVLEIKKAFNQRMIQGPEILTSGKAITMTGGHIYQISREIDGADQARKAAREELKKGVDLLKVIATGGILTAGVEPGSSQLTLEEIRAIVEEAHKAERRVSAHTEGREGILNSLVAGVDTIEHGIGLDSKTLGLMQKNSSILIPTLAAPRLIVQHGDQLPAEMVKKAEKMVEIHKSSFALAYNHGCTIAVGTDAGTPFNPHGKYSYELRALLTDGMQIEELLQAASLNGAKALGIEERCGNITVGKDANLTILDGVSFAGEWYNRIKYTMHKGQITQIN